MKSHMNGTAYSATNTNLKNARDTAQQRANISGNPWRIFIAYNTYCLRPADAEYFGVDVEVIHPSKNDSAA